MSGELELDGHKLRIVVFRNGYKTDANRQPNYIIYRDEPTPGVDEERR